MNKPFCILSYVSCWYVRQFWERYWCPQCALPPARVPSSQLWSLLMGMNKMDRCYRERRLFPLWIASARSTSLMIMSSFRACFCMFSSIFLYCVWVVDFRSPTLAFFFLAMLCASGLTGVCARRLKGQKLQKICVLKILVGYQIHIFVQKRTISITSTWYAHGPGLFWFCHQAFVCAATRCTLGFGGWTVTTCCNDCSLHLESYWTGWVDCKVCSPTEDVVALEFV